MNNSAFGFITLHFTVYSFGPLELAVKGTVQGVSWGVVIICTHIPVIVLPEETGLGSRPHVLLSSFTFLLQVQYRVSALHLSLPGKCTRPASCLQLHCHSQLGWPSSLLCAHSRTGGAESQISLLLRERERARERERDGAFLCGFFCSGSVWFEMPGECFPSSPFSPWWQWESTVIL